MCRNRKIVDMGFTDEEFPAGTHMCLIYSDEEERQKVISRYLSGGLSTGEMSWALKDIPGADRLMEYEARVNDVLVRYPVTAVCQYDANKFDGATILDCLKVHPYMIVYGQVVRNPYYMKTADFLRERSARRQQ